MFDFGAALKKDDDKKFKEDLLASLEDLKAMIQALTDRQPAEVDAKGKK